MLVIYKVDLDKKENIGVVSKMHSQVNAFRQLGFEVDFIYHKSQSIYINENEVDTLKLKNKLGKFVFTFAFFFKSLLSRIDISRYDLVYIRYPFSGGSFIKFLQNAKKTESKVILEFPTFPYDEEIKLVSNFSLMVDKHYRQSLHKYVDYVVHFGPETEIYSIPTIRISNGIDTSPFKAMSNQSKEDKSCVRIVFVGKVHNWHGLDRLIKTLSSEDQFEFNIVGEGPELGKIKMLVKEKKLENNFIWHGVKQGKELIEVLSNCDIGIGTLGIHRKGLDYNSSLKHRLYAAAGLPFVFSTDDIDFPYGTDFVKQYVPNDTDITLPDVMEFLKSVSSTREEIKDFAEALSWGRKMSLILQELKLQPIEK